MVIRRTPAPAAPPPPPPPPLPPPRQVSVVPVRQQRRRQEAVREVTVKWEVSKYRSTWMFLPGHRVTVFQPDSALRNLLVEFRPGLRLIVSDDDLQEFTKEVSS